MSLRLDSLDGLEQIGPGRYRVRGLNDGTNLVPTRPPDRKPRVSHTQPQPVRGQMNKTELRFAQEVLGPLMHAGEISRWAFEPVTFHLARRLSYRPDFGLWFPDGRLEFREVKGTRADGSMWSREKGLQKTKMFARSFPEHRLVIVWRYRGEWREREVRG